MLLAIDTSAGTSVAIVDLAGGVLAEASSDDTRRHAEVIGELIESCLAECAIPVSALSGMVAGMGPGPFTGLRVGIAAARAFAFGAGKIVVPVVSHDAVAFGATEPVLVVTDARRSEIYWSTYLPGAVLAERTQGPTLAKATALESIVAAHPQHRLIEAATISAGSLGMVAELQYANRIPFAADVALYLRSPDVTLSAGPKRVTG